MSHTVNVGGMRCEFDDKIVEMMKRLWGDEWKIRLKRALMEARRKAREAEDAE